MYKDSRSSSTIWSGYQPLSSWENTVDEFQWDINEPGSYSTRDELGGRLVFDLTWS